MSGKEQLRLSLGKKLRATSFDQNLLVLIIQKDVGEGLRVRDGVRVRDRVRDSIV